jgi:tetratricopeptide (TPR) repeat protein
MRGARFLSFMLVLLSPFGALTASQAVAAPMAGPASEKLGTVAFANSCAPEAQESFERGVALLHSFAFAAGEKAFREALDRDPACAIATWGIATILIGNTFALGPSPESVERAAAAIERGHAIGAKSQRERDYIEAIAAFYDRFLERPQAARMRSLSDAFEALAARYKDDDETQIFSALYLTASQPLGDKTYARALKAAAILDAQFAKHPDHPGVAHYLIHAYDFPPIAQKGLPAALCYADIAPGAAHALHMPSHIFTRVGLWKESVATNARSAAAAKAENSIGQALHAMDYMVYADLQLARDADALAVVKDALGLSSPDIAAAYARAAIPARYAVEREQWREAAALPDPAAGKFPYIEAMTLFARAVGAARSRDPGAAEKDVARLAVVADALKAANNDYWATEVEAQRRGAAAWIAFAGGRRDEALSLMRAAADLEDASEKSGISPGRIVPARELLGDMQFESGRFDEALAAYEATLVNDPKRFRSFYGAAQAAAAAGNRDKARYYFGRVVEMTDSGSDRPALTKARAYLAAN